MSNLPQYKIIEECCQCRVTDTPGSKVGKETYCLNCHRANKAQQQIEKANLKNKVRQLGSKQRNDATYDELQDLKIDLDRVVSRYVRLRDIDSQERATCFTCDKKVHYLRLDCGHFVPRVHISTRWLIQNLKPQCKMCNIELRGNLKIYAERLELENKGILEYLQQQARVVAHPTREELKHLLFDYQQKLRLVEQKLK
jgi:hypothetical protein